MRRSLLLPLVVSVLLAGSGCMAVGRDGGVPPAGPGPRGRPPVPVVAQTPGAAREEWGPVPQLSAEPPVAPPWTAEHPQKADRVQKAERLRKAEPPRKAQRPRKAAPAAARPEQRRKPPRRAVPVRSPRPRPVPAPAPGRVDMARLCAQSQGITSPALTRLCRDAYGR
ncbi:hypothetical protein [Streptomyces sp. NPDC086023]|uniref:hypothetical protein n=1 Tax=Streptomyces sp. NPDC086023 TaxID=3365746 RepID=UPI0037D15947